MIKLIKRIIFALRYKRAVRRAIRFHQITGLKHLVIIINRKPVTVSKRDLKNLIKRHRFKKGVTVQDIESKALFITPPKQPLILNS